MKFSGKMWLSIKSRNTRLHPFSLENTDLRKAVKISDKRTLSKISEFLILDAGQNWKLQNLRNFIFSSKSISWPLRFCLNSFLSFLNLELQQLSKFEVKAHFPRFPKFFLFWVKGKTENLETEILFFSAKNISWSLSFCLSQFFLSFFQLSYNLHVQVTAKIWSKGTLSKISEFSILYIGQNQTLENLQNVHFFF